MKNVLIGSDPEVFVTKGGQVVSAIGLIGGSKAEPLPVEEGALQEDNVLAEFNINPCSNEEEFVRRINGVHNTLRTRLGGEYSTVIKSSHEFEFEKLLENPKALEFGCDPDYNAYTKEENPSPAGSFSGLRTAGGHVHIGYPRPTVKRSQRLIRALDVVLGIPSVILDKDNLRRSLYGKAGSHRIKTYGVEYRVLSNFWLANDDLIRWVYKVSSDLVYSNMTLTRAERLYSPEHIQEVINTSNVEAAKLIIDTLGLQMP